MVRRKAKTDKNHNEVIDPIRELPHVSAKTTHDVGGGFGDWVIGCNGYSVVIEIKDDDGTLEASQERFKRGWKGGYIVARTSDPILAWINFVNQLPRWSKYGEYAE